MMRLAPILALAAVSLSGPTACAAPADPEAEVVAEPAADPVYRGVEAVDLGDGLHNLVVRIEHPGSLEGLEDYVTCIVAGYTLEKNHGFARHLRTNLNEEGGVWSADAVYTISKTLPRGLKTIDAEATVADCAERGIPTV